MPTAIDGEPHDCLADISERVLPRADLIDVPLADSELTLFVDGSSRKLQDGTNATGYAVVTQDKTLKAEPLPRNYSAQAAEIVALTEACKIAKGKVVTIYTDSQYAFSTIHVFAQQWKNRGMVTSTGKDITHKDLILALLDAIQLPKKVAICKCSAHTGKEDPVSSGNAKADAAAKLAATTEIFTVQNVQPHIDQEVLRDMQKVSQNSEKQKWKNKGATLKDELYV